MRTVVLRHGIPERHHALSGGVTGLVRIHLDRDRHAMEGSEFFPCGSAAVRIVGEGQRLFRTHLDEGVEVRVDLVDPF